MPLKFEEVYETPSQLVAQEGYTCVEYCKASDEIVIEQDLCNNGNTVHVVLSSAEFDVIARKLGYVRN